MKNTGVWKKLSAMIAIAILSSPVFAQDVKPLVLEDGTPVRLLLDESVSSESARNGDLIRFDVVEDVSLNGIIVIPRGSTAWATVTKAESKKRMGRGGKLDINIDKVRLADGEKIPLRAVEGAKGGGNTAGIATGIVLTSLVLWPAAPLFLLIHGKDVTIPQGRQITAFTQGDIPINAAKFTPESLAASLPPETSEKPTTKTMAVTAPVAVQRLAPLDDNYTKAYMGQQESLGDYARRMKAEKAAQK